MRIAVAVAVVLASTLAAADPAPKPTLSAADQKKYAALLAKGRQQAGAHKLADALATFEAALVVAPDDAMVLGELGLAAYEAKDYARAETATRRSIARSGSPNVLGAAQFNLGLIEEAKHDAAAAIAAYSASLRARPNSTVRARLAKLDAKAAAALDPYRPVTMVGPFPSIAAYCAALPATAPLDDDQAACTCAPLATRDDKPVAAAALTAPFTHAQLVRRTCTAPGDHGFIQYGVAVQLASGWFVDSEADDEESNLRCDTFLTFAGATMQGAVALVELQLHGSCIGFSQDSSVWDTASVVVVGIGASKVPAATPPIVRTKHEVDAADGGPEHVVSDLVLAIAWGGDGTFTVSGKTKGLDPTEAATLLGTHALVFP